MNRHLSWVIAGGICIFTSTAHAQPDLAPPTTPNGVPPVTIVPATPDTDPNKKRVFFLRLKHVRPSLMAYWLDPVNHPLPPGLPFVAPKQLMLPAGIARVIVVDPQNSLLVFGTETAVAQLQKDVEALDKPLPDGTLTTMAAGQVASLELSVYWIDSLIPDNQKWQNLAVFPRLARPEELASLNALIPLGRASQILLPPLTVVDHTNVRLPFGLDTSTLVPPSIDPPFAFGKRFTPPKFDHFTINPNSTIDPGIQGYKFPRVPPTVKGDLTVQPLFSADGHLWLHVKGTQVPSAILPTQEDSTILLSGSASEWGLTPPSPRFNSFVLSIQPHIQTMLSVPPVATP